MQQAGASSTMADEREEHLFKILVIGDIATGKTSLIKRYVHNIFTQHYRATIGVDFALKVIVWDPNTVIRLQLWDIAGQERFSNMTRVYYKEASAAVLVFDATRADTFLGVSKWKADLDAKLKLKDGRPLPTLLLANKVDMPHSMNFSELDDLCATQGYVGWFQTSAKENTGVQEAFQYLIQQIFAIQKAGQYETPVLQRDPRLTNGAIYLADEDAKRRAKQCCVNSS